MNLGKITFTIKSLTKTVIGTKDLKHLSLRNDAISSVSAFLMKSGIVVEANKEEVSKGIIQIINSLSDYYEEGNKLYPEVILIDDLKYFDSLPVKLIKTFKTAPLSSSEIYTALKMCAPMTSAGWHIFMEVKTETITWGVITTLLSETSIPLGYEVMSDKNNTQYNAVYIRNTNDIGFVSRK